MGYSDFICDCYSERTQMSDLPEFEKRSRNKTMTMMTAVFSSHFVDLKQFEDGHFRVIFKSGVFTFAEEQTEPSNSQWSTLKKRLKRRDHQLFVFKDNGKTKCPPESGEGDCYYLDFGFFLYD
jgi:hypothetical protein